MVSLVKLFERVFMSRAKEVLGGSAGNKNI
jgi:hypothetical protein